MSLTAHRALAATLLFLAAFPAAQAQSRSRLRKTAASPEAARVLILVNDAVGKMEGTGKTGASVWVGEYYAEKRGIPSSNILHLNIPNTEDPFAWDSWHIPYSRYEEFIRQPVLKKLC